MVALDRLDLVFARTLFEDSLAMLRQLDDQDGVAIGLHLLGDVASQTGDLESARACFVESLTILCDLGHRVRIVYSLAELAVVAGALGGPLAAARLWVRQNGWRTDGFAGGAGRADRRCPRCRSARASALRRSL